jgi:UDP-N-acetylglucosamine 2-epimerase
MKVVTITGIRPDFIRMSEIFKKLDKNFEHLLIHTGQHYDEMMSDVFFKELEIRKPDYNLGIGAKGREHFHQTAEVAIKTIELLRKNHLDPDIILFLGDSNSVTASMALKKEGYFIGHIEAGMRSGDRRMLEEINRTVCDHCSDLHFVYHEDYKENLVRENLPAENIYVIGNTIVEVCNKLKGEIINKPKTKDFILMDIHRPENFRHRQRMVNIFNFANFCNGFFNLPIKMISFGRTISAIKELGVTTGRVEFIDLMSYKNFLKAQYNSAFMISDSGTAQEEPALLRTPVIVPRSFTERPQSMWANCSYMLDVNNFSAGSTKSATNWIQYGYYNVDDGWLGDGTSSDKLIDILKERL